MSLDHGVRVLGVNPVVLYAVADRLAQHEGAWKPFTPTGWVGGVYRTLVREPVAA